MADAVNHPSHYHSDGDYEVIKVLEAWDLELAKGFCWGNLIKYTARAGKKGAELEDREKAVWYADRLAKIVKQLGQDEVLGKLEGKQPPQLECSNCRGGTYDLYFGLCEDCR
jgi:hypothetical protein